jgi:Zn-dependent M28 family amino/carboxypeptidase
MTSQRRRALIAIIPILVLGACVARQRAAGPALAVADAGPDTVAISTLSRELSSDPMRGRGPWTRENERAARRLATELERLGARPVFGNRLLVPFVAGRSPDSVFNVVGVLPARTGTTSGQLAGITAHLDHLGVGPPVAGDSIYNGFLDAALPVAMVLDVARRYARAPGDRPLVVMFFNLEEQGLLGSKALVARSDARPFVDRLQLLIGVDAGSPAGEAMEWQLMGALPAHTGARLADSLARARGWTTTATAPRSISDVFPFSQQGVPILFPIPGRRWNGYTDDQRTEAMRRFDHYHQPSDEWRSDFPLVGTAHFADWLWSIVKHAADSRVTLR